MAVEAFTVGVGSEVFTAEAFMAGAGSQAFMAEAFMAGVVSGAFTGAVLGTFTTGVSPGFTVITVFLAMVVFSFPASMGTRGGGIGVIPIIGVTRITPTTIRIIRTPRISQDYPATLRKQGKSLLQDALRRAFTYRFDQ